MFNCENMEAIGGLAPELRKTKSISTKTLIFKKLQCFYVAMVNFNTVYIIEIHERIAMDSWHAFFAIHKLPVFVSVDTM